MPSRRLSRRRLKISKFYFYFHWKWSIAYGKCSWCLCMCVCERRYLLCALKLDLEPIPFPLITDSKLEKIITCGIIEIFKKWFCFLSFKKKRSDLRAFYNSVSKVNFVFLYTQRMVSLHILRIFGLISLFCFENREPWLL